MSRKETANLETDDAAPAELPPSDMLEELEWQSLRVATFRAALKLRVWQQIALGAHLARQIAHANGWDATGARMLLDALCSMKLLDKDERGYQLVPVAEAYLIPGTANYMGDTLLASTGWEGSGGLADAIRTGMRPIVSDWTSSGSAAVWAGYEAPSHLRPAMVIEGKAEIWRLLDIAATEGMQVLDVACGSAGTTLALAMENPGVLLTLNDWPGVVQSALAVAEELGITAQVASLPGDIETVEFGSDQYDLIWVGDILHSFGRERIVGILGRLNRALKPGGVLVVSETVVDEARREAPWLLGSLWLYAASAEGDLYAQSEWLRLLRHASLIDPVPVRKEGGSHIWVKASKRYDGQSPAPK